MWSRIRNLEEIQDGVSFLFTFANVFAVNTTEGLVLIDSGSLLVASNVFEEIRVWSKSPVHSVIFTHGHVDHVFGVLEFDEEAKRNHWSIPRIVAHKSVVDRFNRYKLTHPYNTLINTRQFDGDEVPIMEFPTHYRYPDVTYEDQLKLTIGEEIFELHHARGETDDATWIWLPKKKILCTGDLFIWSAPNAGNPQKVQRYPWDWASALREMDKLDAELLAPGHGPLIFGKERIHIALSETANFLQSLVDQTLELMNRGLRLNAIIHQVTVPKRYREFPFLKATYDEPEFIVHNIWRYYGGWWDANPSHLKPPKDEVLALEIAQMTGGASSLMNRAEQLVRLATETKPEAEDTSMMSTSSSANTKENAAQLFALACSLAELAIEADPANADLRKAYASIYLARSSHWSTTSLMARGLFAAAAREHAPTGEKSQKIFNDHISSQNILSSIWKTVSGWLQLDEEKNALDTDSRTVSISQDLKSSYDWLEKPLNFTTSNRTISMQLQDFVAECRADLLYLAHGKGDEWQFVSEEEGIRVMETNRNGFPVLRAQMLIPFPPRSVMAFLLEPQYRGYWNMRVEKDELLQTVDPQTEIRYRSFPRRMFIAGRDFVFVAHWYHYASNGTFVLCLRSIDGIMEEQEDYIRGQIFGGGLTLEALEDGQQTMLTSVLSVDIGMHASITRQTSLAQAKYIKKIRDSLRA